LADYPRMPFAFCLFSRAAVWPRMTEEQAMTIFYHIVENDPLDNGHGSEVIQGTPGCTIEGHDGRMRKQAFLGHLAYCGVCRNSGQIAAGPGTPRDELRMVDATIQAREAVEGDIVLCECDPSPRLVAVHGRCSYIQDDSGAQLASDGGGAFTRTALAVADVAARSAPSAGKLPLGDRRNATDRRCTLRIGVFFDGAMQSLQRQLARPKPGGAAGDCRALQAVHA